MPTVSVLYVNDKVVGPHLDLLRRVCEPASLSRPHVTVRYFDRLPITAEHLNTSVDHIDIIEPGAFGFEKNDELFFVAAHLPMQWPYYLVHNYTFLPGKL